MFYVMPCAAHSLTCCACCAAQEHRQSPANSSLVDKLATRWCTSGSNFLSTSVSHATQATQGTAMPAGVNPQTLGVVWFPKEKCAGTGARRGYAHLHRSRSTTPTAGEGVSPENSGGALSDSPMRRLEVSAPGGANRSAGRSPRATAGGAGIGCESAGELGPLPLLQESPHLDSPRARRWSSLVQRFGLAREASACAAATAPGMWDEEQEGGGTGEGGDRGGKDEPWLGRAAALAQTLRQGCPLVHLHSGMDTGPFSLGDGRAVCAAMTRNQAHAAAQPPARVMFDEVRG